MMKSMLFFVKGGKNLLKSLLAVFIFSRLTLALGRLKVQKYNQCVILGNGPSLKQTLQKHVSFLSDKDVFCVNDFVASPYFSKICPKYYVFMDPVFWSRNISDQFKETYEKYLDKLKRTVDWDMTIFLPTSAKKWNLFQSLPYQNHHISLCYVNTTEVYSSGKINSFFYRKNLAMPRVQNVLTASIFIALNLSYKKIFIVGADHSWHESIRISDKNVLYLKNNRFQDDEEQNPSPFYLDPAETTPYQMSNLFRDLSKMFYSYAELEQYSKAIGAKIYNASEKSFIDAFERYNIRLKGKDKSYASSSVKSNRSVVIE